MGNEVLNDVWRHAASWALTPTELLVLLRLADSAGDESRMGWESARTISKRIGTAERSVFRSLAVLEKRGIISTPPKADWPREALLYKSIVRRILPVEEWPYTYETEVSTEEGGDLSTDRMSYQLTKQVVAMTPVSYNPRLLTTNSSSHLDTSYLESPLPSAPLACSTSGGWDAVPDGKPKRVSKSAQRAAAAKAEQESTDPFVVLSDDSDMDYEVMPPARVDQARRNRILSKRAERRAAPGPAAVLAERFALEATEPAPEEPADRFGDAKAMASNFARWRRDGASDEHLRDMIHEYWHGSFRRNLAAPAWKDFIASQDKIHAQLERRLKAEEVEANRHNPGYWT